MREFLTKFWRGWLRPLLIAIVVVGSFQDSRRRLETTFLPGR